MKGEILIYAEDERWHIVHTGASIRNPLGPTEVAWCERDGAVVCFMGEELAFAPLPDYETTVTLNAKVRGELP